MRDKAQKTEVLTADEDTDKVEYSELKRGEQKMNIPGSLNTKDDQLDANADLKDSQNQDRMDETVMNGVTEDLNDEKKDKPKENRWAWTKRFYHKSEDKTPTEPITDPTREKILPEHVKECLNRLKIDESRVQGVWKHNQSRIGMWSPKEKKVGKYQSEIAVDEGGSFGVGTPPLRASWKWKG